MAHGNIVDFKKAAQAREQHCANEHKSHLGDSVLQNLVYISSKDRFAFSPDARAKAMAYFRAYGFDASAIVSAAALNNLRNNIVNKLSVDVGLYPSLPIVAKYKNWSPAYLEYIEAVNAGNVEKAAEYVKDQNLLETFCNTKVNLEHYAQYTRLL